MSRSIQLEREVSLNASPSLKLCWKFSDLKPPAHKLHWETDKQTTRTFKSRIEDRLVAWAVEEYVTIFRLKAGWVTGSGHGPQWGTWAFMMGRKTAKTTSKAFIVLI